MPSHGRTSQAICFAERFICSTSRVRDETPSAYLSRNRLKRAACGYLQVMSRIGAEIVLERSVYDTEWSLISTRAKAVVNVDSIRVNSFQSGPQRLEQTPHYRFYLAILMGHSQLSVHLARETYLSYMRAQNKLLPHQCNQRLSKSINLINDFKAGAKLELLVRPFGYPLWMVTDGFHRAALLAAAGEQKISVRIHW